MVDTLPQQAALAGGAGMKTFIVTIIFSAPMVRACAITFRVDRRNISEV